MAPNNNRPSRPRPPQQQQRYNVPGTPRRQAPPIQHGVHLFVEHDGGENEIKLPDDIRPHDVLNYLIQQPDQQWAIVLQAPNTYAELRRYDLGSIVAHKIIKDVVQAQPQPQQRPSRNGRMAAPQPQPPLPQSQPQENFDFDDSGIGDEDLTAAELCRDKIDFHRAEVYNLENLLPVVENMQVGSPTELALRSILKGK